MIARFLIALLRGCAVLLGALVLLLALVMLLERPSFWISFGLAMVAVVVLKVAAALWAGQEVIGRLFGPKPAAAHRSPHWIGPRRRRESRRPLDDDSRGTAQESSSHPANELGDVGLYPPDYTPDTGPEDTRSGREDRSWN